MNPGSRNRSELESIDFNNKKQKQFQSITCLRDLMCIVLNIRTGLKDFIYLETFKSYPSITSLATSLKILNSTSLTSIIILYKYVCSYFFCYCYKTKQLKFTDKTSPIQLSNQLTPVTKTVKKLVKN